MAGRKRATDPYWAKILVPASCAGTGIDGSAIVAIGLLKGFFALRTKMMSEAAMIEPLGSRSASAGMAMPSQQDTLKNHQKECSEEDAHSIADLALAFRFQSLHSNAFSR